MEDTQIIFSLATVTFSLTFCFSIEIMTPDPFSYIRVVLLVVLLLFFTVFYIVLLPFFTVLCVVLVVVLVPSCEIILYTFTFTLHYHAV